MTHVSPRIIQRADHCVSRKNISQNALKVLYRLADAGFDAYLVGGSVRDLLLGRVPKDFDVATSAQPDEVRALFRNCRLIGRRFRLAHIHFADDIIEVATFRGEESGTPTELSDHGRILRDNTYGDIHSDVWRRDFTVNALYYNIKDYTVWDYVGGVDDIDQRCLRLLGDPEKRYREDPVRMLRAARFAAKLGFRLDDSAANAINACAGLLHDVPPARKFEEVLKLFLAGHAGAAHTCLVELGLFEQIFPANRHYDERGSAFVSLAMESTDARVSHNKPVTPFFLFGAVLWPAIEAAAQGSQQQGLRPSHALQVATARVLQHQQSVTSMPRRIAAPMREMVALQPRLLLPQGRRTWALLRHQRFRAAYDLLLLRGAAGMVDKVAVDWWTKIQDADEDERREMIRSLEAERPKGRRRRRRRRRRGSGQAPAES